MTTTTPNRPPLPAGCATAARTADKMILVALAASCATAVCIGQAYGALSLALLTAGGLLAVAVATSIADGGTLRCRFVLGVCLAASVALHIQLGRGTLEFHFGVFVTMALVLVYRDWRPIVATAAFFAVHHLLFDRLQAGGLGVYCTPAPDFAKVVLHAGYLIVQTALEVYIAVRMNQLARQGEELERLVHAVGIDGTVSLDLHGEAARTLCGLALKGTIERIGSAMAQVSGSAATIQSTSSGITDGNRDLSRRTEQTVSSLRAAAASIGQLTGSVRRSADAAAQASVLAGSAAEVAARGGAVVAEVVSTMVDINASSKRIADITGVIDGIAFQTNILALNAAVEAARAGEQGRGFAVVASEVRSLAQRSAEAAKEIKALIGDSVDRVESGSKLVGDAGSTMGEIVASVQRVSDIIGAISAMSSEQSAGIGEVDASVTQLNEITQQNVALVEQSAAAAESLKDQARRLSGSMAIFRLGGPAAAAASPAPAAAPAPAAVALPARLPASVGGSRSVVGGTAPPARRAAAVASPRAVVAGAPAATGAAGAPTARATAGAATAGDWETF